ncbi:Altered inheritance of mitochondria protein 9, mitochondrial [Pseudocercospora fuligena]|uniref:Altered inheritance of mitochondria protein 9, mitochondrial n=1 Tax=Pseudocercospora fuligena TaxID=685502 RepID=A0A8H6RE11_9PEZI|nr:Altered inheritance of mitochondria protein 9, mitochondrial [Pseudocercospora fuligena]
MSTLGSESWLDAGNYGEDHIQHTRVKDFIAKINWTALLAIACRARSGISCKLSEKYSRGQYNVVRKLEYEDGVDLVARLRLPDVEETENLELLGAEKTMEVEIATMAYLKKHTSIPVPEVFAHDLDPNNQIGAPYILMSYIHGTSAAELSDAKDYDLKGDEQFWSRMAEIQMELASLKFNQIGCIYQHGDAFSIGPEVVTGRGPWATAEQFWYDLATHFFEVTKATCDESIKSKESFHLPQKFSELMKLYGEPGQKQFRLANRDSGIHNVLVNDDFEIVGLIDLDGVMAAPVEMVARLPRFSGFDRPMPYFEEIEKRPMALKFAREDVAEVEKYIGRLQKAGEKLSRSNDGLSEVASAFASKGASVVDGLHAYHQHQDFVNDNWWAAYQKLLQDRKH